MLSDERLREIMKQWSAGQQTGHHIPDLLAEIDRLKSELNGAAAALELALPYVQSQNSADHFMEGFGPRVHRESDTDMELIAAACKALEDSK
jgi:hypothetical protein